MLLRGKMGSTGTGYRVKQDKVCQRAPLSTPSKEKPQDILYQCPQHHRFTTTTRHATTSTIPMHPPRRRRCVQGPLQQSLRPRFIITHTLRRNTTHQSTPSRRTKRSGHPQRHTRKTYTSVIHLIKLHVQHKVPQSNSQSDNKVFKTMRSRQERTHNKDLTPNLSKKTKHKHARHARLRRVQGQNQRRKPTHNSRSSHNNTTRPQRPNRQRQQASTRLLLNQKRNKQAYASSKDRTFKTSPRLKSKRRPQGLSAHTNQGSRLPSKGPLTSHAPNNASKQYTTRSAQRFNHAPQAKLSTPRTTNQKTTPRSRLYEGEISERNLRKTCVNKGRLGAAGVATASFSGVV